MAHIHHAFPFSSSFLHMNSNLTEFNSVPGPTLQCPPFQQTSGDYSSSSTTSKVVRVQRAARSESGQPAARTSPLSPPLKLNCATERMKVSMAAFFLLILILTTTSALGSQPSESTSPRRAAMRKGNGAAGSEVRPRALSGLRPQSHSLSPPACTGGVFKLSPL